MWKKYIFWIKEEWLILKRLKIILNLIIKNGLEKKIITFDQGLQHIKTANKKTYSTIYCDMFLTNYNIILRYTVKFKFSLFIYYSFVLSKLEWIF